MKAPNPSRNHWQRRQIPLLHDLMDELCHCQTALVARDLTALQESVQRQIQLALEIQTTNQVVFPTNKTMLAESAIAEESSPASVGLAGQSDPMVAPPVINSDRSRSDNPCTDLDLDLALSTAYDAALEAEFNAAALGAQHAARVQTALLRRSLTTVQALGNLLAMEANTYTSPDLLPGPMPELAHLPSCSTSEGD